MTRNRSFSTRLTLIVLIGMVVMCIPAEAAAQRGSGTGGGTGAGTGGGRGPIAVPATAPRSGGPGRAMMRPADKSPAGIALAAATDRIKRINKAVSGLDKTAAKTAPKNLAATDQQQWSDVGTWILSAKTRYAAHAQLLTKATQTTGDEMDLLAAISALDEPFYALHSAVTEEGGKFADLGKAAKSRHDAAMSAIKGIK